MRNGMLNKSNELGRKIERWTKITLLVVGAAVTRIGVFLLVGR